MVRAHPARRRVSDDGGRATRAVAVAEGQRRRRSRRSTVACAEMAEIGGWARASEPSTSTPAARPCRCTAGFLAAPSSGGRRSSSDRAYSSCPVNSITCWKVERLVQLIVYPTAVGRECDPDFRRPPVGQVRALGGLEPFGRLLDRGPQRRTARFQAAVAAVLAAVWAFDRQPELAAQVLVHVALPASVERRAA